jgi:hypothetical protein
MATAQRRRAGKQPAAVEPPKPELKGRQQPTTMEQAIELYPKPGTKILTIGGTYPDRVGTVVGITDKNAESGWLYCLIVDLPGGVVNRKWETQGPGGSRKPISKRFTVEARRIKLQPGSWIEYAPPEESK